MSEDRRPEDESWWDDWGKYAARLALGILGVVAAMAIAVIVVVLIL